MQVETGTDICCLSLSFANINAVLVKKKKKEFGKADII